MSSARFAIRTIQEGGSVKINGRIYRVDEGHLAYDGRLDGQRFAFGLYPVPYHHTVYLWGPESMYRAAVEDEAEYEREWENNPACVDGSFPWEWWREGAAS